MYARIFGLISLLLFSSSCSSQADNLNYSKLKRIIVKADGQDNITDLVEDYKYIRLETRPECIISNIDKILYRSGKFYILDAKAQALFVFDKDGKFISKIEKPGRGPGEYIYLMDFDIDIFGNIYLLDLNQKAILKYDMHGKFIEKDQRDYFISNIAVIDTSTLLTYQHAAVSSNVKYKLIFQENGEKVNSFLPIDKSNKINMLKPFPLNHSGHKLLYNEDLSDTIFSVTLDSLYARYFIDFGRYSIDPSLRSNYEYFLKSDKIRIEGWRINNYFETSHYFTCTYNLNGKTWSLYYSLVDGKTFVTFCPDCDETPQKVIGDFRAIGVCGDYFISYLKIHTIQKYKSGIANKPNRMVELIGQQNIELIQSIDLADNPVLVLYKMK